MLPRARGLRRGTVPNDSGQLALTAAVLFSHWYFNGYFVCDASYIASFNLRLAVSVKRFDASEVSSTAYIGETTACVC